MPISNQRSNQKSNQRSNQRLNQRSNQKLNQRLNQRSNQELNPSSNQRLNQKGLSPIFILILLLLGVGVGIFLVKTPAIFTPKAAPSEAFKLPDNAYDIAPAFKVSDVQGYQQLISETFKPVGIETNFYNENGETYLEFVRKDMTEEEAKQVLIAEDKFYQRVLMQLLLAPRSMYINNDSIDPRYALCDHYPQELLDEIGALPTFIYDDHEPTGKRALGCKETPNKEMFVDDRMKQFDYKKLPAKNLLGLLNAAKFLRENKSSNEKAQELALSLAAGSVFGELLSAMRTPGITDQEVSDKMLGALFNTVLFSAGWQAGTRVLGLAYANINWFSVPVRSATAYTLGTLDSTKVSILIKEFGGVISQSRSGLLFLKDGIITKIVISRSTLEDEIAFMRAFGGVGGEYGIPKFYGEVKELLTGKVIGFRQEFIRNFDGTRAKSFAELAAEGGPRLTEDEVIDSIKRLKEIYEKTKTAHGDLTYNSGRAPFHAEQLLLQNVGGGVRKTRIVDWGGWNQHRLLDDDFIRLEFKQYIDEICRPEYLASGVSCPKAVFELSLNL